MATINEITMIGKKLGTLSALQAFKGNLDHYDRQELLELCSGMASSLARIDDSLYEYFLSRTRDDEGQVREHNSHSLDAAFYLVCTARFHAGIHWREPQTGFHAEDKENIREHKQYLSSMYSKRIIENKKEV